jgi:Flp pilus assembly protein TadD
VPHLRRAAELDPGNVQVLRMLSVALDRTGRKEEAALWRERLQRAEGY